MLKVRCSARWVNEGACIHLTVDPIKWLMREGCLVMAGAAVHIVVTSFELSADVHVVFTGLNLRRTDRFGLDTDWCESCTFLLLRGAGAGGIQCQFGGMGPARIEPSGLPSHSWVERPGIDGDESRPQRRARGIGKVVG